MAETGLRIYDEEGQSFFELTFPMGEGVRFISDALTVAAECGQYDGSHHKMWVIDQMVRALTGERYGSFVKWYERDGEYTWDTGIAP